MGLPFKKFLTKEFSRTELAEAVRETADWWKRNQRFILAKVGPAMREFEKNRTTKTEIGKMYFFIYDAKTKDQLEYWDAFPLIFPIERYKDGFLGINLHYLDYQTRSQLMAALFTLIDDPKLNENAKLKISYGILNRAKKYKAFKPCIKRYLYTQIRSSFVQIPPEEWTYAMLMPREQFQKASKYKVWEDSKRKI